MLATLLPFYTGIDPSDTSGFDVEKRRSGRQPFTVVELFLDECSREFGVAPCLATGEKCYKTRASCKHLSAYAIAKKTFTFCPQVPFLPSGLRAFPALLGVEITPPKIDPGKGLGLRADATIHFQDFQHNDFGVDPYLSTRAYDPMEQGTFFGRLRARNPFYNGRVLKVHAGYLKPDGSYDPTNFQTRTYFIESWSGPDPKGVVTISAKDILKLADDDRAVAPSPSRGKLAAPITAGALAATLAPTGIGVEYATAGLLRLGSELISFTRSGDNLTLVRGMYNTTPAAHSVDEAAQQCLVISGETVQDIAYRLFVDYARVDPVYIDKVEWDSEQVAYLPRLYSAIITSPVGVSKLLSELCEQVGVMFSWDEVAAKIRFQSLRPNGEDDPVRELTADYHLQSDSVVIKELADQRINEVWIYYGILDYTKALDEESNYRKTLIAADPEDQSESANNDIRIRKIFSRWISELNTVAAEDLAEKLVTRYKRAPREATFTLDAKDGGLALMDFARITNRQTQTMQGTPEPLLLQVISAKETLQGTLWTYVAREFAFTATGPDIHEIRIDFDVYYGLNIRAEHDLLYAEAKPGDIVLLRILPGFLVTGPDTETWAVDTGVFADGVILRIVNEGIISGRGGNGGNGGSVYATGGGGSAVTASTPGEDGGPGLRVQFPVSIDNGNGVIMGGNGGGGGGGAVSLVPFGGAQRAGGSGGGGGWPLGLGGLGGTSTSGFNDYPGFNGEPAVRFAPIGSFNPGGGTVYTGSASAVGGAGGRGWNLIGPAAGDPGVDGYLAGPGTASAGSPAGAVGHGIEGVSFITWEAFGEVYGVLT